MCERGETERVWVKIPADISGTGYDRWSEETIDACIAPLVRVLQNGGVNMRGSCCGHGREPGGIQLQDGRVLLVLDPVAGERYMDDRAAWFAAESARQVQAEREAAEEDCAALWRAVLRVAARTDISQVDLFCGDLGPRSRRRL